MNGHNTKKTSDHDITGNHMLEFKIQIKSNRLRLKIKIRF